MRILKQLIIAFIFLFIIGGISYWVYLVNNPAPRCDDGIKNGFEEGVDCGIAACGLACEPEILPIEVKSTRILKVGPQDYDFIAEVSNPNREYGASEAVYELTLLDNNNQEVLIREGLLYILPGQTKFAIITAIKSIDQAASAQLKIKSAQWEGLASIEGMNFSVRNETYNILENGASSELMAIVMNNSDYDFAKVDIGIVLFNDKNEILAVHQTDVRTLLVHTERQFNAKWPFSVSVEGLKIRIDISTNLYDNLNYIKRYGSPKEKFQKYY